MIVQNEVNGVSADEVMIIPDPTIPLIQQGAAAGWHWNNSNQLLANPAGEYRIQNALVDKNNAIGPWSLERVITLPENWVIMGSADNQPCDPKRMAIIWRALHVETGTIYWLTEGLRSGYGSWDNFGDAYEAKTPFPFSSNNPLPYPLMIHARGNAGLSIYTSVILAGRTPAPAPDVWPCLHPLTETPVYWSWATISGESRLSPVTTLPGLQGSGIRRLVFNGNVPLPCGVLGRYIYVERDGVARKQIADPRLQDTPGVEKYLFQPQDNQPILWDDRVDGPIHLGPATGCSAWSIVSPTQKAMFSLESEIILPADPYIYGPLIDPCLPGVKGRLVGSLTGAGRVLRQVTTVPQLGDNIPANTHPTYWPMIVEMCDEFQGTTWRGIFFQDDRSRGPGASMAVTSSDSYGGGAFSACFENCVISVGNAVGAFEKKGLHIGWESAAYPGAHTASEWIFKGCDFYGNRGPEKTGIGISICGTQSVNFIFEHTHMLGIPCAAILIDGGTAFFRGLFCGRAQQLFLIGWASSLDVDQLFIDQVGNHALVDFLHPQIGRVSISRGQTCGFDAIARAPVTTQAHDLHLNNWPWYKPSLEQSEIYAAAFGKMNLEMVDNPGMLSVASVTTPSNLDYHTRISMYPPG